MKKNQLSIIIPIYNALDDLKILLKSILKNFNFELGEVTLINDCSNKETSNYLETFCLENNQFNLLKNEKNLGFIKTCNRGMKEAKGEIVVLLNSDTQIPKDFCERIIKCFQSDKEIGIASPISSNSATYYIPLPFLWSIEKMNKEIQNKHICTYPVIPAAEGFCFCIRKNVIEQQGYLDEIYGKGYHEEVDFAYRAITNGWKNVLIDDLYVLHKRQQSFGEEQRAILIKQNEPVFFERWENFREKYIEDNNLEDCPIKNIKKELNIKEEDDKYNFLEKIFSVRNEGYNNIKYHKVITFLGLKIKIKNNIKKKQIRGENK